jgi:hypothetical protein
MKGWHAKAGNVFIFRIDYGECGEGIRGKKFLDRLMRLIKPVKTSEVPASIAAEPGKGKNERLRGARVV